MPGQPIPYRQWGADLDANALQQMENACQLPVSVAAALMPDAHVGYGLPIGGVLATDNAVIPYAVGVDIACRVKLTVLDLPLTGSAAAKPISSAPSRPRPASASASEFKHRRTHPVMDEDWSVSPVTQRFRDKAAAQLGTSGSGNHFVEFGEFTVEHKELGLEPGMYLALLSHSGSRGTGAQVCDHYSRVARAETQGFAQGTQLSRVARPRFRRRPGILGGDGIDGPIRLRQSLTSSTNTSRGISARACCWTSKIITTSHGRNATADATSSSIAKARRRRARACWA